MKLDTSLYKTANGECLIAYYHETWLLNALSLELRLEDVENLKKKLKTLRFNDHDKLKKEVFKYSVYEITYL